MHLAWDDWQREQLNVFIAKIYNSVTELKSNVKISAAVIEVIILRPGMDTVRFFRMPAAGLRLGKSIC
jgi:uncharacterized lipoprotein YddW (UPF0748 family)